jgi:hypothetical protein
VTELKIHDIAWKATLTFDTDSEMKASSNKNIQRGKANKKETDDEIERMLIRKSINLSLGLIN